MSDYFVMVPQSVYRSQISGSALKVYICLLDNSESFNPGIRMIQERACLNARTVMRSLVELTELGLVNISKGDGKRNEYSINTAAESAAVPLQKVQQSAAESAAVPLQKVQHNYKQNKTKTKNKTKTNPESVLSPAKLSPPPKKNKPVKKTEPKYEAQDMEFAKEWIQWLSDRGSHHAKSAKKPSYATALANLRTKYGLTHAELPKIKELALEDEFWGDKLISPNGLLKKWKDGRIACNALLDKLDQLGVLAKGQVDRKAIADFMAPVVDKIVEADKARSAAYRKAQSEKMRNVTPIRPRLIGS